MPLISPFFRLPGRWTLRRMRRGRMAVQTIAVLAILLVVLPLYVVYKPPKIVIGYFQHRFPSVLFHAHTSRRVVALTIDDAPTQYTGEILELLTRHNASATFFVIGGQVQSREDVLDQIIRAGSELGNHAMHDEPSISLATVDLENEISQVDRLIEDAYTRVGQDRPGRYFRPGSGIFSNRLLQIAKTANYQTILGSIYPHDPFIKFWRLNAWHILSMLRPGAVIICHDRRPWTIPMLKKILPELKKKGYEIVSVSKFLEMT